MACATGWLLLAPLPGKIGQTIAADHCGTWLTLRPVSPAGERETTLGLFTGTGSERGWHDLDFTTPHVYPCIEWGEEYPQ